MDGPVQEAREPTAPRGAVAVALTVLWHLLVGLVLQWSDPFAPADVAAAPEPIRLTFRPEPLPPTATENVDETEYFTELPDDRADAAPDRADARSNVDSRARDRAEGEEYTDLPRMQGQSESPAVAMDASPPVAAEIGEQGREERSDPLQQETETPSEQPAPPTPTPDQPAEEAEPSPTTEAAEEIGEVPELGENPRLERPGARLVEEGETTEEAPRDLAPDARRRAGEPAPQAEPRYLIGVGRDDVFQEEMDNVRGNVPLFGDVSLNTVAWEYAPWLQRFRREFYRNWLPPYAYLLGIIDGHQVVFLEVAPDGRLLRLEVQEEEGHESLRESTVGNFRSLAPYHPLPEDFPEPTLQITIRVVYPGRR